MHCYSCKHCFLIGQSIVINDLVLRSDEASLATIMQAHYLEGKGFACRSSALAAARGILLLPCLEGASFHDTVEVKSAQQNSPAADPVSRRSALTSKRSAFKVTQSEARSTLQIIAPRSERRAQRRRAGTVRRDWRRRWRRGCGRSSAPPSPPGCAPCALPPRPGTWCDTSRALCNAPEPAR